MTDTVMTIHRGMYIAVNDSLEDDPELKPYETLFLKPLTMRKSAFSKYELEVMCKDPMHSPRLIMYLIEFVRNM